MRCTPIGQNSPLDTMLGEVAPRAPIQLVYESKSKVKAILTNGAVRSVWRDNLA